MSWSAIAFVVAFTVAFTSVFLFFMNRTRRYWSNVRAVQDAKFEAWREADEAYFSSMRLLLEARYRKSDHEAVALLEVVTEELWRKAETARIEAMR